MKRKAIFIGGIVLVLLIVGGVFVWQNQNARTSTSVRSQTATVQRGSLVATINAAGNVSAPQQVALAFQTSGRVIKVNVQVGDAVKKSQVLMELDTTDLELALKTARADLVSAQASYDQTKANLDFELRNAQSSLTSAKASLDAAKASADQNPNSLIVAKASLDKATVTLQQAQAEYNKVAWRGDVGMTSQAATLQTATIDYQTTLANYKMTVATINDSALKQAQATYDKAQIALEQAQRNLDTSLRTAQVTLDNVQVAVEQAQRNLDKTRLEALFDGLVAQANYNVGDAPSSTAVVLVNTSRLQVKVTVAEVDVPRVKLGDTAQMTLDALPGKTYDAKVTTIAPVGTVTSGVVNYPVVLDITNNDGAIKSGMTANLAIVVERRENVLLVPTRAVRTQGNQKTVTVVRQGQPVVTPVRTGLSSDQSVEIVSGLLEGDVVMISQTQTSTGGGPGGPPGIGIPFIGGR
jgi:HlyD family secretion protein